MGKKTPLYEKHVALGGKIVEFGGWELPVQYPAGIKAEHMAVRTKCGLFDVSHMGEFKLSGEGAVNYLNKVLTNNFSNMKDGQVKYSPMCNENGGVVDDLLVYKADDNEYLIVVNAANTDKDFEFMSSYTDDSVSLKNVSHDFAQIALQGPYAKDILLNILPENHIPQKYYSAVFGCEITGYNCIVSRTGYTGEDGFEIYTSPEAAPVLWDMLLDLGKDYGLIPCGLGARDTLRLEASMPLYGHEMDDEITPLETGLGFFVKLDKEDDFIGKEALLAKGEPQIARVGLEVTGRGIAREHEEVLSNGEVIGHTTSGTFCPYLDKAVAMALIKKEYANEGTVLTVNVRGREVETKVVPLPFYKRER